MTSKIPMSNELVIPFPIHPTDRDLPLSIIQLKLPSGKVASLTFPVQGGKTIDNAIATLLIWKDTIVIADDFEI